MLSLVMMLSSCCKPEVVTKTETVTVYIPQYRDFDMSAIECGIVDIKKGDKWLEVVINQNEMLEKCVSSILLIERTLNE